MIKSSISETAEPAARLDKLRFFIKPLLFVDACSRKLTISVWLLQRDSSKAPSNGDFSHKNEEKSKVLCAENLESLLDFPTLV